MGALAAIAGPILSIGGGLISGSKAADAAKGQAEALRAAGERASAMAQFKPQGMTTAFGTSAFTPEGQGSYTLSPELKAIQSRLFNQAGAYDPTQLAQMAQPLYGGASSLFGLGQQILPSGYNTAPSAQSQALSDRYYQAAQGLMPSSYTSSASPEAMAYADQLRQSGQGYLAQSPQEAAAKYVADQQALLQPSRQADVSRLQATNYARGTGGLGVNTGTGGGPSNPLAQALFNAQAQQDRQIAAAGDVAGQQRQALGLNMVGQGLTTQQQAEVTSRQNLLQNLGLSLDFGQAGYATGTSAENLARARSAEDIRLGAGLFGTGGALLGQVPELTSAGYSPLQTQLGLLSSTESLGQQPFNLSTGLAGQYAQAGARAGELYLDPQKAAANAYSQYQGYSPMGSALSGLGSSMSGSGNWFSSLLGSGPSTNGMSQMQSGGGFSGAGNFRVR